MHPAHNENFDEIVVKADDTLGKALSLISVNGKGAVVVCQSADSRIPIGILTERDLIRLYCQKVPFDSAVSQHMTANLVVTKNYENRDHLLNLMLDHNIRRIPAIDSSGNLINLTTQDEILDNIERDAFREKLRASHIIGSRREIFQVQSDRKIKEVLEVMVDKKVGMVPIIDKQRPIGVFTEADIIRLASNHTLHEESVTMHMTAPVHTIPEDMLVADILLTLKSKKIHHLLVLNTEGKVAGTITTRDIARNLHGSYRNFLEFKLRQNRESMNIIPNPLIELLEYNGEFIIQWANQSAFEIFGKMPLGGNIIELIEKSQWSRMLEKIGNDGQFKSENFVIGARAFEVCGIRFGNSNVQLFLTETTHLKTLISENEKRISEMRKAKKILEEQAAWRLINEKKLAIYREVIDQANESILIVDPESGRFVDCNKQASASLQYSRDEILKLHVSDIRIRGDQSSWIKWEDHVKELQLEKSKTTYAYHVRKDRTIFPVESVVTLIEFDNKKYITTLSRDITERKRSEENTRLQTMYIQSILDTQPDILMVTDGKKILTANRSFLDFFKAESLADFTASHSCLCEFFIREEGYKQVSTIGEWVKKLLKQKENLSESRVKIYDSGKNENRTFLIRINPFPPRIDSYLIALTDITELEKYESLLSDTNRMLEDAVWDRTQQLAVSEEKLKEAQRIARIGSWEFYPDENKITFSGEMWHILGYEYTESIDPYMAFTEGVSDEILSLIDRLKNLPDDGSFPEVEYRFRRIDGGYCDLSVRGRRSENNDRIRIIGTIQDIAQRKEQEQAMIQKSRMAALGEMVGAIAHQWKQPLGGLSLLVQDLEDAMDYGELNEGYMKDFSRNALEQIEFMEHTIDDFRSLFRQEKTTKPFNPWDAIEGVVKLVSKQMKSYSINIITENEIKSSSPQLVEGKMSEFKHVILNLISNAKDAHESRKTNPADRVINIKLGKLEDRNQLYIQVRDNAGGIPEDILSRIFESGLTTKEDRGTGIGLSISRGIVRSMNGEIRAENFADGALFTILLPIMENPGSSLE